MADTSTPRPSAPGQNKASGPVFTLEDIVGAYAGSAFRGNAAPEAPKAQPEVAAQEIVSVQAPVQEEPAEYVEVQETTS